MAKVKLVTKEGNDPTCTHFEIIEALIGTCKWCGRVKDYRMVEDMFNNRSVSDIETERSKRRRERINRDTEVSAAKARR